MGTEKNYIKKIIKNHNDIIKVTKEVSDKLNKKFIDEKDNVVLVTIMKGGLPFSLELMKHLKFDVSMDFVSSSSYFLKNQLPNIVTKYEATIPIKGKHIIIIDDFIDTGRTIIKITKILKAYKPKSITITAIYGNPKREKTKYEEIYCWEEKPEGFLIGFGLDYDEKYRNLPYIAIIKDNE